MTKEDDVLLCTVKKIEGTTVFVETEEEEKGSILMSEVAAGRIRNLRDFVSPNKKIVCKVLKIYPDHLELSLRRVTAKEREEILSRHKKESTFKNVLKTITNDSENTIEKIKKEYDLEDFIEEAREDKTILKKFFNEEEIEKLSKILKERKEKEKAVKKIFTLQSNSSQGVKEIKEILNIEGADISYLGSSKFSIKASAKNFKDAEKKISEILDQIEEKAKKKKAIFTVKEK